jgi:hypothetical protein
MSIISLKSIHIIIIIGFLGYNLLLIIIVFIDPSKSQAAIFDNLFFILDIVSKSIALTEIFLVFLNFILILSIFKIILHHL